MIPAKYGSPQGRPGGRTACLLLALATVAMGGCSLPRAQAALVGAALAQTGVTATPMPAASTIEPSAAASLAAPRAQAATITATSTPTATAAPTSTPTATAAPTSTPTATAAPSSTPTATVAPTSTPAVPAFTARQNINVRQGPGTDYPVIGGLRAGEAYEITGKTADGDWLRFDYRGVAGWVSAALVTQRGDPGRIVAVVNIPSPPPTATPAPPQPTAAAAPQDPVLADLVARINQARANAGLNQLAWTPELAQAAAAHAGDMAGHNFFSHTGSDGSDVTARMRRAGYVPSYWGEILTHVEGGAGAAFDQFWGSPHHHDIILGDKFRDIGAAWIHDPHDGRFNYFVVVFGRR